MFYMQHNDVVSCFYCCILQVWGFTVTHDETRLITGSADSELRVWKISSATESETEESEKGSAKNDGKRSAEEAGLNDESEEKTAEIHVDVNPKSSGQQIFLCHSAVVGNNGGGFKKPESLKGYIFSVDAI